ncbi:isochorismatase family protein [Pseudonocardia sp. CA-107938]|uniref:isochorismatase family protein n=1 Tax=Pseudonocardia sp. CA-107938 TaxID=3240021 RepID=UPI003D943969
MTDDGVLDRYRQAGFGGTVTWGQRPAVVVVDLTNGFTDPTLPTGADMGAEVAATAEVVDAAHAAGAPVVFTTIAYAHPAEGGTWLRKASGMSALRAGTTLVDVDARLPRREDDVVIVKKGPSAFFGTGLATLLTTARVDTVVVCGATTSGCVRATVVDAVSAGWIPVVPRDCVADRARGPHDASLFDMHQKYADVVDRTDVVTYLKGLPHQGG